MTEFRTILDKVCLFYELFGFAGQGEQDLEFM